MELSMGSDGFSDALYARKNLEILEKNNMKLLAQTQSTKQKYGDQETS